MWWNELNRIFEYKGIIDKINKTYTVYSIFENELYYSLFKLRTKDIEILNNDFKKSYIECLENQFKSSFLLKDISKLVDRVLKSAII